MQVTTNGCGQLGMGDVMTVPMPYVVPGGGDDDQSHQTVPFPYYTGDLPGPSSTPRNTVSAAPAWLLPVAAGLAAFLLLGRRG